MVASLSLSRPTRMFASLTFTGEDKAAPAVCCDLSRVASIIPANRLPRNLVAGINKRNVSPEGTFVKKTMDKSMSAAVGHQVTDSPLPCQESKASDAVSCLVTGSVITGVSDTTTIDDCKTLVTTPINSASGNRKRYNSDANEKPAKLRKIDPNQMKYQLTNSVGTNLSSAGRKKRKAITKSEVSSLLVENEKLKFQNELLKRKLLTFQMILQKEENYDIAVKKVRALQEGTVHQPVAAAQ